MRGSEEVAGETTGEDMKEARRRNPSGWMELTRNPSVTYMIDALIETPPDREFSKSELQRRSGVSRESIRKHFEVLSDLEIVEEVPRTDRFRLNIEGVVTQELLELNSAVNHVRSRGETRPAIERIDIIYGPGEKELSDSIAEKLPVLG